MIYTSDDYINKYCDTLSYLIGRSYQERYSFDYIQKRISYSSLINELEKSNSTLIAFSSMEKIYSDIFKDYDNDYEFNIYDMFGWIGYTYMHLFLSLQITFEALFYLIPIDEMMNLYKLYHEMDYSQVLDYVKNKVDHSLLNVVMSKKEISSKSLSDKTGISVATITALRYGKRDINKLEAHKLLLIANALNVKMETLLPNINLIFAE